MKDSIAKDWARRRNIELFVVKGIIANIKKHKYNFISILNEDDKFYAKATINTALKQLEDLKKLINDTNSYEKFHGED